MMAGSPEAMEQEAAYLAALPTAATWRIRGGELELRRAGRRPGGVLPGRGVSEGYDAAVIGAGVGGLTAAACLAREGLRVLVLEQEPHPGGTAYTFIRRGYQFPMGPLGFSSPGPVREAWEGLTGQELRLRRVDYLLRAFGLEVPLSLPYPRLEEELQALFPGEAAGIRGFFDVVRT